MYHLLLDLEMQEQSHTDLVFRENGQHLCQNNDGIVRPSVDGSPNSDQAGGQTKDSDWRYTFLLTLF